MQVFCFVYIKKALLAARSIVLLFSAKALCDVNDTLFHLLQTINRCIGVVIYHEIIKLWIVCL
jgi:hypothetical protein